LPKYEALYLGMKFRVHMCMKLLGLHFVLWTCTYVQNYIKVNFLNVNKTNCENRPMSFFLIGNVKRIMINLGVGWRKRNTFINQLLRVFLVNENDKRQQDDQIGRIFAHRLFTLSIFLFKKLPTF
jgi:hypothetical protein